MGWLDDLAGFRRFYSRGELVTSRQKLNAVGGVEAIDNAGQERTDIVMRSLLVSDLSYLRGTYDKELIKVSGFSGRLDGGEGVFEWSSSSNVAEIPGMIVGTGPGQWHRVDDVITPQKCGAVGAGVVDDTVALNVFAEYVSSVGGKVADLKGSFLISDTITFDGDATKHIRCNAVITASSSFISDTDPMVEIANAHRVVFSGSLRVVGTGGASMATRTVGWGVKLSGFNGGKIDFLDLAGFKYFGLRTNDASNNNGCKVKVRALFCGPYQLSGAGATTATWNTKVDTGSTGSFDQRSTITVSTLPSADFYLNSIAVINGVPYQIKARDAGASTISVFPWIDTGLASGTISYVIGAGVDLVGADCGMVEIAGTMQTCAVGLRARGLYGCRADNLILEANLVGIAIASGYADTSLNHVFMRPYFELNTFDILKMTVADTDCRVIQPTALDYSKCIGAAAPRLITNDFSPVYATFDGVSIVDDAANEHTPSRLPANTVGNITLAVGPDSTAVGESYGNNVTISLQDAPDKNRLFGYGAVRCVCFGNGSKKQPTGTITIQPSTADAALGYTVMGGATYAISGLNAPLFFYAYLIGTDWAIAPVQLEKALTGSATYDPASIAVGGSVSTTVTVTGAAVGDHAVASFSNSLQGLSLTAYVSATDTVTCVFSNNTAGAVDLASGTLRAKVVRQ